VGLLFPAILSVPSTFVWYFFGYRFYIWLLSGTTPLNMLRDLVGLQIAMILISFGPLLLGHIIMPNPPWGPIAQNLMDKLINWAVRSALLLFPFSTLLFPTLCMMLIISVLMFIIAILRGITVRIAESDKGPVLALSALLAIIGTIVKSMQGR
jgi:hypothetical protein